MVNDLKASKERICQAMDGLGIAVTLIDPDGILTYYNKHAAEILDRKPEYIGKEVYSHHLKAASSERLESMIQAFKAGRTEPFFYEAKPYGKAIFVTLSPIVENGAFVGCAQAVQLKADIESKYICF